MEHITFKQANRRYRRAFFPLMLFYSAFCFAGPILLGTGHSPRWALALVAFVTGAPIAGVFWLIGRLLRETDEYTRAIQMEALISGGAITLSAAVVWSFLELYEVVPRVAHFPSMMMVGPGFFLAYGISFGVQELHRRRVAGR